MNRKHLIAGLAALALLCILNTAGLGNLLFREMNKPPQASNRDLVAALTYCNSTDRKPCIVSFSLDTGNNTLLVNILIPDNSYPDFYLTISNTNEENRYECQQVDEFPTNIYCTGKEIYPGEVLHFAMISSSDEHVLAEGNFSIIGLLLVTPNSTLTSTVEPETANELSGTPTPFLLDILTPSGTEAFPSFPSPSYPNPSYP